MRLATPGQQKEIERLTDLEFHVSDEVFTESAGALAAREVHQAYLPELTRGRLAVLCWGREQWC